MLLAHSLVNIGSESWPFVSATMQACILQSKAEADLVTQ
jgi:hypothetical protein